MSLELVPVVSIVVVCYLIGALFKAVPDEKMNKWIPVIVGFAGGALGIAAWLTVPGFAADNWLTALEVGIVSGLASTGVNQVYKQFTKDNYV